MPNPPPATARLRLAHAEWLRKNRDPMLWDMELHAAIEAVLAEAQTRGEPDWKLALEIAKAYEKAPCFNELLGEVDPENPCACPSCALRAIRQALTTPEARAP